MTSFFHQLRSVNTNEPQHISKKKSHVNEVFAKVKETQKPDSHPRSVQSIRPKIQLPKWDEDDAKIQSAPETIGGGCSFAHQIQCQTERQIQFQTERQIQSQTERVEEKKQQVPEVVVLKDKPIPRQAHKPLDKTTTGERNKTTGRSPVKLPSNQTFGRKQSRFTHTNPLLDASRWDLSRGIKRKPEVAKSPPTVRKQSRIQESKQQRENQNLSLSERYRPQCLNEIAGNGKNIEILRKWIRDRKANIPTKHFITLIHGPAGIGKTSVAHALLKEEGFNVHEVNASLVRTSKAIQTEILGSVTRKCLLQYEFVQDEFGGPPVEAEHLEQTALVLDEIDGGQEGDNGASEGVMKVIEMAEKSRTATETWAPIICICNEMSSKSIRRLSKAVQTLRFFKPFDSDMDKILTRVLRSENIAITDREKRVLIGSANGDVRRLLGLLEAFTARPILPETDQKQDVKSFVGSSTKDVQLNTFDAAAKVLTGESSVEILSHIIESDVSINTLMLHENYPRSFNLRNIVSLADIFSSVDQFVASNCGQSPDSTTFQSSNVHSVMLALGIRTCRKQQPHKGDKPDTAFTSFFTNQTQQQENKALLMSESGISVRRALEYQTYRKLIRPVLD